MVFIQNSVIGSNLGGPYYLDGVNSDGVFMFTNGPEVKSKTPIYNTIMDICYTHCPWVSPPFEQSLPCIKTAGNGMMAQTDCNSTLKYICEFGGSLNITLAPVPVSGGTVTIYGLPLSWDSVTVTLTNGNLAPSITPGLPAFQGTVSVEVPPGTNFVNKVNVATVTASGVVSSCQYQYMPPSVSHIEITTDKVFVIHGLGFTEETSSMQPFAKYGNGISCDSVSPFDPTSIKCTSFNTVPIKSIFPITVTLGSSTITTYRSTIAQNSTHIYSYTPTPVTFNQAVNKVVSKLDGVHGTLGWIDPDVYDDIGSYFKPDQDVVSGTYTPWSGVTLNQGTFYSIANPNRSALVYHTNQVTENAPNGFYLLGGSLLPENSNERHGIIMEYNTQQIPIISMLAIPTSGSPSITISSSFLGTMDKEISVKFFNNGISSLSAKIDYVTNTIISQPLMNVFAPGYNGNGQYIILVIVTRPSTSGDVITITGTNYYTDVNLISIMLGTVKCTNVIVSTPHTSLKCTAPPGTGAYPLSVTVKQTTSLPYTSSYIPPTVTNVTTGIQLAGSSIIIQGTNFGNDATKISVLIGGKVCQVMSMTGTQGISFICGAPPMDAPGDYPLLVKVDGLSANQFTIKYIRVPVITEIVQDKTTILITGYFRDDPSEPLQVAFNGTELIFTRPNVTSILCSVPSTLSSGQVEITFTSNPATLFSFFTLASPIEFGTTGLVTIDGDNFVNVGLMVSIGGSSCNVTVVSTTRIVCTFVGTVPIPDKGASLPVNVTVDSQETVNYMFYYTEAIPCPQCTIHGKCNSTNGHCECDAGYDGATCAVKINPVIPLPPPTTNPVTGGTTISANDFNFTIGISHIRERLVDGTLMPALALTDATFTNRTKISDELYHMVGFFKETGANIVIDAMVYNTSKTIIFANLPFTIPANSIKYVVAVSNWTFSSPLSTLQVIFLTHASGEGDGCSETKTTVNSDFWVEVQSGSSVLRGHFAERLYVDKRVAKSTVVSLDAKDPLYAVVAGQSEAGKYNLLTAIEVPHFTEDCLLDPSFGSLVTEGGDSQCKEEKNKWKIPVIVVCSVVGAALITGTLMFLYKKKFLSVRIIEMKLKTLGGRKS
eukprot:gene2602-2988_t